MSIKRALKECDDFFDAFDFETQLLSKVIHAKTVIKSRNEKVSIVEAFVFRIDAEWTIFVKHILYACLSIDSTKYAEEKEVNLPKKLSLDFCRLILNGNHYLDFRSVGQIKKMAKDVIADQYNPFKNLSGQHMNKIDEFYTLRNLIAHRSFFQKNKVEKIYKKYNLKKFVAPGSFLFSYNRNKKQARIGDYLDSFIGAVREIESELKKMNVV